VSRRTCMLYCDVHHFLFDVPLCNCDAPPFGFWNIQFYLSKKKKNVLLLEKEGENQYFSGMQTECEKMK
jgi:hypothetical protein